MVELLHLWDLLPLAMQQQQTHNVQKITRTQVEICDISTILTYKFKIPTAIFILMQVSVKSSIYILLTVPEIVGPLHTQ